MGLDVPTLKVQPNGMIAADQLRRVLEGQYLELLRLHGQIVVIADTGVLANTEFAVAHDLRVVPSSVVVLTRQGQTDAYLLVKPSGTAWTSSTIYLKCNADNAALTLRIYK